MLVNHKAVIRHRHFCERNLFSPWYSWKFAHLGLSNNHSLSHFRSHSILPWKKIKVVSLNPTNRTVYSINLYVINLSDLRRVGGSLLLTPISSTNKTDCHDMTEILLIGEVKHHTLPLKINCFVIPVWETTTRWNFGWRVRSTLYSPDRRVETWKRSPR